MTRQLAVSQQEEIPVGIEKYIPLFPRQASALFILQALAAAPCRIAWLSFDLQKSGRPKAPE
ncbi:MAG: hypothetical protein ABI728_11065 [Betaproteobacteria bacterium]